MSLLFKYKAFNSSLTVKKKGKKEEKRFILQTIKTRNRTYLVDVIFLAVNFTILLPISKSFLKFLPISLLPTYFNFHFNTS